MYLPEFRFNFHDALLCEIVLGPRYDVTMIIQLDPVWNVGSKHVRLHFSKIENHNVVSSFCETIKQVDGEDELSVTIDRLEYDPQTKSKANDLHLLVSLDGYGDIQIHCGRLTISEVD
jgi:hypothetical protein